MREFLKGLDLDIDTIDTIMAEYGKMVTKDKEEIRNLTDELSDLRGNSKSSAELQAKYDELKKQLDDRQFNDEFAKVSKSKKFVNDYTKSSIMNELKSAMSDENNKSKSMGDLFEEITKDKEGIFANPNKPADMSGTNETIFNNLDKDAFSKMGYKERVEFKAENPDLFEKLNSQE